MSIWLGTQGKLDPVPVSDVLRYESEFLEYVRREHSGILDAIRETKQLESDTEQAIEDAVDSFNDQFETSEGKSIKAGTEDFEALPDEDVEQEQIVKQKRG